MKRLFLFLMVFVSFQTVICAQNLTNDKFSISGIVKEKVTGRAIIGANVYIANSTIGDATDTLGNFTLKNVPPGVYKLMTSHIAYSPSSIVIDTDSLKKFYTILLTGRKRELDSIEVIAQDSEEWKNNFQQFQTYFLGSGNFSLKTKILNPETLNFYFNTDSLLLKAFVRDRLHIENRALGYRIDYDLKHFSHNYKEDKTLILGTPYFTELSTDNLVKKNVWLQNREIAYKGSFDHFKNSLINKNLASEGYSIHKEKLINGNWVVDSSFNSPDSIIIQTKEFLILNFTDRLRVRYFEEKEEQRYLHWIYSYTKATETKPGIQESFIYLTDGPVKIDRLGYIYEPLNIIQGGYWSFEKIPYLLPIGYNM